MLPSSLQQIVLPATKTIPSQSKNRKSYIQSKIENHVIGYRKSTKCACGTYNPLTPPLVRGENTTHGGKQVRFICVLAFAGTQMGKCYEPE